MPSVTHETVLDALRSGETDRVNEVLDAVEDLEPTEQADLLAACFDDCRELYRESDDGYQRQSVVRFFAAVDPCLQTASAYGTTELRPDDLDLTEDGGDYRDALVEFYLTAIRDDDGRVRKSVERELNPLATRWEMLGEQARLDALHACLDDLAEATSGKTRETVVAARQEVRVRARSGGTGLRSAFREFADADANEGSEGPRESGSESGDE